MRVPTVAARSVSCSARQHVKHRAAGAAGKRIAAEGGAVRTGAEHIGRGAASQASANGDAVAEGLGQGHDVGQNAGVLVSEQLPGAPHAGLNLVEHQQPTVAVAKGSQSGQIVIGGYDDATLALDRLHQHGDDVGAIGGGGLHGVEVVVGHAHEALHERLESGLGLAVAGGRQGCQRAAVEAVLHHQHLGPVDALAVGVQPGQLDGGLVGLRAGVREKHPIHAGGGAELVAECLLRRNSVEV